MPILTIRRLTTQMPSIIDAEHVGYPENGNQPVLDADSASLTASEQGVT
jgi:hypothetical protein